MFLGPEMADLSTFSTFLPRFLDELDHFGASFASGLRQFLDGVCQPSQGRVLVVATTNRLEQLPGDLRHRAELVRFERPQSGSLAQMWRSHARHLRDEEVRELAEVSVREKVGRA